MVPMNLETKIAKLYEDIFYFIQSRVKNKDAAEDISQTVMMKAFANVGSLKKKNALKSWLMTIASNEVKLYFRSLLHYKETFADPTKDMETMDMDAFPIANDLQSDILQHLVNEEDQITVMKALSHLDEKYEIIIRLHVLCDFGLMEIAEMEGININTVRTRYVRGLRLLKNTFDEMDKGELIQEPRKDKKRRIADITQSGQTVEKSFFSKLQLSCRKNVQILCRKMKLFEDHTWPEVMKMKP